ncbi:hypothetical protein EXIGLDRAFT_631945 [Exidia glandulosa HHB12029]|uniref:CxC2-like cysteine cluster KDZ transposase-associated domain-containing protein n=1 Tax=Exidia glandulosa HHB12029 TaxID=1314781 RepID=A0A165AWN8_EXIGL|nr:hypothetical protein EXIGLDRAFT_631945 [Exidia glandulosa HHB12029]
MRYGFIASTPLQPAFAIGMHTLELYRQLRLFHPRLGFQPFARAIAAFARIPYRTEFRRQLSDSFDIYLRIRREVKARVDTYLGRDTPDWRVLYGCPPCGYMLQGEPTLAVARLWCMDGNGSPKRHASAGATDPRIFASNYFLDSADKYKDEVQKQSRSKTSARFAVGAEPGDTGDTSPDDPLPCTDNWKNMQPEHMKRQLDFFEQTGIFLGACRHGFILFILEMIRSGELAKYPLALVAKMLELVAAVQRAGYDIGCGFRATLAKSSIGALARALGFDSLTNAFHGHAHHRLCQLRHHPLVSSGVGLEDFETCERVFSESNDVARTIRFATHFHWRQYLDMHFHHWDDVKYAELSRFIASNYEQALKVIKDGDAAIAAAAKIGIDMPDFVKWREQEIAYLEGLKKEPEGDVLAIGYVETLMRLDEARSAQAKANVVFVHATPEVFKSTASIKTHNELITKLEREKRNADRDVDSAEASARLYEEKLAIPAGHRWTDSHKEWHGTIMYIFQRQFRRALDNLERLVVQRLFELTKANMSDTSYKLRQQIAKALQRRSRAIQSALKAFNVAQKKLDADADDLTWKTVVAWTELADFSLLRMARRDIRNEPWAKFTNRELMTAYFKKLRAEEELVRCNVEARRLRTWIEDEDRQLATAAARAEVERDPIAVELRELQRFRAQANHRHRVRLRKLELSKGFTGTPGPGMRQGAIDPPTPSPTPVPAPSPLTDDSTLWGDEDAEGSDDEAYLEQAERLEEIETAAAGDEPVPLSFYS